MTNSETDVVVDEVDNIDEKIIPDPVLRFMFPEDLESDEVVDCLTFQKAVILMYNKLIDDLKDFKKDNPKVWVSGGVGPSVLENMINTHRRCQQFIDRIEPSLEALKKWKLLSEDEKDAEMRLIITAENHFMEARKLEGIIRSVEREANGEYDVSCLEQQRDSRITQLTATLKELEQPSFAGFFFQGVKDFLQPEWSIDKIFTADL